jgi:hypothetical protein
MKVYFIPRTVPGKCSAWLIVAFIILFAAFWLFVVSGQRGGQGFFDNLLLTIPMLLAGASAVASFFTGLAGVIVYRERAILVYTAMVIGLCVLLFIIGEIAVPH